MYSTRADAGPSGRAASTIPRPSTTNSKVPSSISVKRPASLRTVSPSASVRWKKLPQTQPAAPIPSAVAAATDLNARPLGSRTPIASDGWMAAVLHSHLPQTLASQVRVTTTPVNLDSSLTVGSSRHLPTETVSRAGSTTVVTIPRLVLAMEETTTFLVPSLSTRGGGDEGESRVKVIVRNAPETHKRVQEYVLAATNPITPRAANSRSGSTIPTLRDLDGAARDQQRAIMRQKDLARASSQDDFKVALDHLMHYNRKMDRAEARRRIREGGYIDAMPSPGRSPRQPTLMANATTIDDYCYLPRVLTPRKMLGKTSRLGTPARSRSSPSRPNLEPMSAPITPKRATSPLLATTSRTLPFDEATTSADVAVSTSTDDQRRLERLHANNLPLWEQVQLVKPYPPPSRSPSAGVSEQREASSVPATPVPIPRLTIPQTVYAHPMDRLLQPAPIQHEAVQTPRALTRRVLRDAHTQHNSAAVPAHAPSMMVVPMSATSHTSDSRRLPSASPVMHPPRVHLSERLASWGGDREIMTVLDETSERRLQDSSLARYSEPTNRSASPPARLTNVIASQPINLRSSPSATRDAGLSPSKIDNSSPSKSVILEERRLLFEAAGLLQPKPSHSPSSPRLSTEQKARKLQLLGIEPSSATPFKKVSSTKKLNATQSIVGDSSPEWIPSSQSESEVEGSDDDEKRVTPMPSPRRPVIVASPTRSTSRGGSADVAQIESVARNNVTHLEEARWTDIARNYKIDHDAHLASLAASMSRRQHQREQEALWWHQHVTTELAIVEQKEASLRYGDEQHEDEVWMTLMANCSNQQHLCMKGLEREGHTRRFIEQCEAADRSGLLLQAPSIDNNDVALRTPSGGAKGTAAEGSEPSPTHTSRRLSEEFASPAPADSSNDMSLHELSGILASSPQTDLVPASPQSVLEVAGALPIAAVHEEDMVRNYLNWLRSGPHSSERSEFADILASNLRSQDTFSRYTHETIMQEVCDDFGSYFSDMVEPPSQLLPPRGCQPRRHPRLPRGTFDGVMECFTMQEDKDGAPDIVIFEEQIIDSAVGACLKAYITSQVISCLANVEEEA